MNALHRNENRNWLSPCEHWTFLHHQRWCCGFGRNKNMRCAYVQESYSEMRPQSSIFLRWYHHIIGYKHVDQILRTSWFIKMFIEVERRQHRPQVITDCIPTSDGKYKSRSTYFRASSQCFTEIKISFVFLRKVGKGHETPNSSTVHFQIIANTRAISKSGSVYVDGSSDSGTYQSLHKRAKSQQLTSKGTSVSIMLSIRKLHCWTDDYTA